MPDILLQLSPDDHNWVERQSRPNRRVSGYSRAMDKWLLFVLAFGAGGVAFAQDADAEQSRRDAGAQTMRAQKRIELRSMLSVDRSDAKPLAPATEGPWSGRQLSAQERAEMREQLRRFQPVSSPPRQP